MHSSHGNENIIQLDIKNDGLAAIHLGYYYENPVFPFTKKSKSYVLLKSTESNFSNVILVTAVIKIYLEVRL